MLKINATVTAIGTDSQALARLREMRRRDGAVAMSEDQHQDLLELEREQTELAHAKWAAMRVRDYLASVTEDGGEFRKGGSLFVHTACIPYKKPRLEEAVKLAADVKWVGLQLTTLRVKPRHMDAARSHLNTLVVKLIEREVGNGY